MNKEQPQIESLEAAVAKRGLPSESTWQDVNRYDDKMARSKEAKTVGLPEDSSWNEIFERGSTD
ncbi:hypothetical protein COT97_03035 [Candidatus Falkowbacteria bacterium CG10_big_fil_rev_8_21_14_0_10_39_11]|uniref:Uncharacterized protein n=1 Tax=Candidatus Falkowbacteria bacterium CG10_big_fil_rev_8_21_14_0_10_39_11 TaxID=1974565 RepID=A0A2H0V710_9BACT|nr:MAG: hypothetical protein COT97_03035 [Candidatus Falkowbacteria bacterium CG10_big_fil_rev_8_21_14_0_10_39_11]